MAPSLPPPFRGRTALVVAHPGHELRVHGLVARSRPLVFILTDGSGRTGRSRLDSSRQLIARAGARPGDIFGRFSDREFYEALLSRDPAPFVEIAERMAHSFVHGRIVRVVGDALDGYNPGHDVCRLLIDAAVTRARVLGGVLIESFSFSLLGPPDRGAPHDPRALGLPLTPEEFTSKLEAARACEGLDDEVDHALSENGAEAFRTEWLWTVTPFAELQRPAAETPPYERFGEERMKNGFYQEVIRYETHIRPLAAALFAMSTAST